ncbi:hypothetical protein Dimus_038097 [Dionaea muscipula]
MEEIHESSCGSHQAGSTLAKKIRRQGYFWPQLERDTSEYVRRCPICQKFARKQHSPSRPLTSIASAWPFAIWGIDIQGPYPIAPGEKKFLIVAVDYFTKWVEAESTSKITGADIEAFLWKFIICRFGVPRAVIIDNGTQFEDKKFKDLCREYEIDHRYASVAYPQSNGQVKVTNKTLVNGLKTRVSKAKGNWIIELPTILWSYRTTPRAATGGTPFSLAFGVEAVVPVEIGIHSYRIKHFSEKSNDSELRNHLDALEERREQVALNIAAYQQRVTRFYNSRVRGRSFRMGELVLRDTKFEGVDAPSDKLTHNWEGPYEIVEKVQPGTYRLRTLDERDISRTWNLRHL